MGFVEAIEFLALKRYLMDLWEAEDAAEQANTNDAVADDPVVAPQYEIAIGDNTPPDAILEICRQQGTVDAFESIVDEGVVGHVYEKAISYTDLGSQLLISTV